MRYVDALKIWNESENNGKWCFPSKGTESHKSILEIMKGKPLKEAPKKQIKFKIKQKPKPVLKKRIIKVKKKQQGNGLILPGRQQRGRGADLPWDVILDVAQNPMSYVNKAGKFLDSQSGTKQMADQIERKTGAKRLFRWPWEN